MMQHVHQAVKVNLKEAQECSKRYYDKTAKERTFFQGDRVMVFMPNAPPRINPKFFSHWVPYTVVQMVGKVNAQVRNRETGKSSIIHLDRIRELRENLEEEEDETGGMQQHQQRDEISSHAGEKQQEQKRVSRGPAGAAAAVLAQDRDIRDQLEAERGVNQKQKAKPKPKPKKTRKQFQMQAGWLPRLDHADSKGPRTRSRGLEINYLDDHRTDPAEKRRRLIWAEESKREEEEQRDWQDYMHTGWRTGPTTAQQEAGRQADQSFGSATSGPAWQGWQSEDGQGEEDVPFNAEPADEADFFTQGTSDLSDILGAHAQGLTRLGSIDEAEEDKQLADLGIQADPEEVRQVPQLPSAGTSTGASTRRRGRSGGLPPEAGAVDYFSLPNIAAEYTPRKKKVQAASGESIP